MGYYERTAKQERLEIGVRLPANGDGWWLARAWVAVELAALMYLNIRLDYLRIDGYLREHWRHWVSWTAFALGAQAYLVFYPQGMHKLEPAKYFVFGLAWLYYYVGNWLLLGPLKKALLPDDRARALRAYEFIVVSMWLAIQIAFQVLCVATRASALFGPVPQWLTTVAGVALIVVGYGVKGWATWLIGVDNYFWRDLLLETPNERLVSTGVYRFLRHPTYGVGYLQGYGFAVLTRSAEGLLAAAILQAGIFLFVKVCEEPRMRLLYGASGL